MSVTILEGDCRDVLAGMPTCSVHTIVTDPPYGLGFMGKDWDNSVPSEWIVEASRVLKPGGHLLAFGGSRTYHRLACSIEDAGFELRDSIIWLYGSGFPKSLDVSKAIDRAAGAKREVVGTERKKRMASPKGKPNSGYSERQPQITHEHTRASTEAAKEWEGWGTALKPGHETIVVARKPLIGTVTVNVTEHGTGALNIDGCRLPIESADDSIYAKNPHTDGTIGAKGIYGAGVATRYEVPSGRWPANVIFDEDAAQELEESRFFYCAKASRAERGAANNHPTVKPIELMRWLVRLVTPPGGTVLDPFAGSGTTLVAAIAEGLDAIGIEQSGDYCRLIEKRVGRAQMGFVFEEASA